MPFSRRNGFGKVHRPFEPSTEIETKDQNFAIYHELYELLHTFTAVEEAAIRQIVPLQSIIRLGHGNLASKGNTYCVYKKSKLHTVLPLLPSECNYIVVTRTSKKDGKLKSTKFKRYKIGRALELLKMTGLDVWNIEIDQERLKQWPEEGDLCDLRHDLKIVEVTVDEKGEISSATECPTKQQSSATDEINNSGENCYLTSFSPLLNIISLFGYTFQDPMGNGCDKDL